MIKKPFSILPEAESGLVRWFIIIAVCLLSLNIYATPINTESLEFESSELPIVIIDTDGQTITSSARIIANMGIVNNGAGNANYITDPYNEYNGKIRIEIRGHSSKGFDQKSYRIETQDVSGNNNNVSLMGMPKDNDWVLYGPYSDKSLIRNALVYNLAGEINSYAPRTRFCELVLNNSYQGVYLLIEKIKEDNNRVNITKLKPEDINEPGITGGYMFKKELSSDKGDNVIILNSGLNLSVIEPRPEEILPAQTIWLKNYLNSFESALYGNDAGYTDFLDIQSLADNFLMVEFFKNVDGFRASTYFYKDRGDKIVCGPVWDYNLSLGNADYNYGWTAERWYHVDEKSWPFYWFDELLSRDSFWNLIESRWAELRKDIIEYEHINSKIDSMTVILEDAQVRHFNQWHIMGKYTWPNPGFPESGQWGFPSPTTGGPTSWEGEIEYLKNFVRDRLDWMDGQLGYKPDGITPVIAAGGTGLRAFPNPCSTETKILINNEHAEQVILRIYSLDGHLLKVLQNENHPSGEFGIVLDTHDFKNGLYLLTLQSGTTTKTLKLIVQK